MKRLALPFVLGFGVCLIVLASPARGQERVVRTENTEIVFAPADSTDIPIDRYKAFDKFANDHPDLVTTLSRNPRLANNPRFLKNMLSSRCSSTSIRKSGPTSWRIRGTMSAWPDSRREELRAADAANVRRLPQQCRGRSTHVARNGAQGRFTGEGRRTIP